MAILIECVLLNPVLINTKKSVFLLFLRVVLIREVLTILVLLNRFNLKKLSYEERKAKLIERLNAFNSVADDDDEDDE